jgi:DNA polymerase-4
MQLFSPSNVTNEIHRASCRLFDELWDGSPIRQLGIHTSKIVRGDNSKQINLFDMNRYEKLSKLDVAVDMIRERYGENSIVRAVFLDGPIYHMSGGISPEKRKAKYKEGVRDL